MGLRLLAALAASLVGLASSSTPPVRYLQSHQNGDGGFAERGDRSDPTLTGWALLGLRAAGAPTAKAREYLLAHESELESVQLGVLAEAATGRASDELLARLGALEKPSGAIGQTLNATAWGLLALAQAGRALPRSSVRFLLRNQSRSGGWSWHPSGAPDSNDTAATIEALRAAGVRGRSIRRGLAYLRRLQNHDGGFALTRGAPSDTQSTAWAIQAFLAAGVRPAPAAYRFLARMRRADGSYRYTARYAVTPMWVTAQVLPALSGKAFPLR